MQAASRESRAAVGSRFDEIVAASDQPALDVLGDELSAVTGLLSRELTLRKHLSEPSSSVESRKALVDNLLRGKIGDDSLSVLHTAVAQRWSRTGDLVETIEHFGRQAVLSSADSAGNVETVEDELFRFGRIVDADPRLGSLLGDEQAPVDGRLALLDNLIGQRAQPQTIALLKQYVQVPRNRRADVVTEQLAELAASRKNQSVAQITAAAPLSEQQSTRLAQVLASIYGRTISLQVQVDPEIIGGLHIQVGDEIIDGSLASKLAKAGQNLPN